MLKSICQYKVVDVRWDEIEGYVAFLTIANIPFEM